MSAVHIPYYKNKAGGMYDVWEQLKGWKITYGSGTVGEAVVGGGGTRGLWVK